MARFKAEYADKLRPVVIRGNDRTRAEAALWSAGDFRDRCGAGEITRYVVDDDGDAEFALDWYDDAAVLDAVGGADVTRRAIWPAGAGAADRRAIDAAIFARFFEDGTEPVVGDFNPGEL
ncbi:hypothetical protein JL722_14738 [Aureococcus anophagefferens]|nr:hypothetical protein JL722_14738 [Aureococcus anophagefferens]